MSEAPGLYAKYRPPGPKAEQWLNSIREQTFLIGPVGSAKTTSGCMKGLQVTRLQHPSTKDGVRKALILATRMNYRRMSDTLIPSFKTMWPESKTDYGELINGKYSTNEQGLPQFDFLWADKRLPAGSQKCAMSVWFRAYGEMDIESFIRGFQPTAWYLSEADEQPQGALGLMIQRAGRAYLDEKPDDKLVKPAVYSKIYGDLNAPDEDNWFTQDILMHPDINKPDFPIEVIWQPSGFDPNAENLENLRRIRTDYYEHMAKNMEPWAVERFIKNKIGMSRHGAPVFTEYDNGCEVDELKPEPGTRVIIGVDQGNRPACAFTQKDRLGRMLIFDEAVPPPDEITNGEVFGEEVAVMLLERYRPWCVKGGVAFSFDPAGRARDNDARRWYQNFMLGVYKKLRNAEIIIPHTNRLDPRLGSVRQFLRSNTKHGGRKLLVCKKKCPTIRRGFMSGYRLMRVKSLTGKIEYKLDKNQYADPMDAVTYAAMVHSGVVIAPEEEFGGGEAHPYSPSPQPELTQSDVYLPV